MNQVFCQAGHRNLRFKKVLLWHFAGAVLDSRGFDPMARRGYVLIMDSQLVLGSEGVIKGFANADANI